MIQQVWLASLLWWVAGRAPARVVEEDVGRAVGLLLAGGGRAAGPGRPGAG